MTAAYLLYIVFKKISFVIIRYDYHIILVVYFFNVYSFYRDVGIHAQKHVIASCMHVSCLRVIKPITVCLYFAYGSERLYVSLNILSHAWIVFLIYNIKNRHRDIWTKSIAFTIDKYITTTISYY